MRLLRTLSLPLLHRGDRLLNSITTWFILAVCASLAAVVSQWSVTCLIVAGGCWLFFVFWFSARLQRELARRDLAEQCCPVCGEAVGEETATRAFESYADDCHSLIEKAKADGAFSIEPGSPLVLNCPGCSAPLFFDYLHASELSKASAQ
jgi:hypothetical protein